MVFHWSSSDRKSPQVSRTILRILADLNIALIWMVSTRPLISKPNIPCTKPLVIVPSAPVTFSIMVTLMFHSFSVLKQSLGIFLSILFLSVLPCGQPEKQSPLFSGFSLVFLIFFILFYFFFFFCDYH